jgi:pimeloyl-ACP methyl ester carboxylesterase
MPIAKVNGIALSFAEYGPSAGEPVVLVTGSGGKGQMWTPHQVPALTSAGYRVITIDNRGVAPTQADEAKFTIADMVADTAALIDYLNISPARIVGFSLGGIIVQELLVAYPHLISQAVLMASRGRTDAMRAAMVAAEIELSDSGVVLPRRYAAVMQAMLYLSGNTRNDARLIRDWLDIFEMVPPDPDISRAQRGLDLIVDRLDVYRQVKSACLVIAFGDDSIVPTHMCRELADHIPGCQYEEIADCGHYGCLERPEVVNSSIIKFFGSRQSRPRSTDEVPQLNTFN